MPNNPIRLTLPPPPLADRHVSYRDVQKIMDEKRNEALIGWALQTMGERRGAYIERAELNFNTLFGMQWELVPENEKTLGRLRQVVEQVPYTIPLKISGKNPVPENLVEIWKDYELALRKVKQWKKSRGQLSVRARCLQQVLPEISWEDAWVWTKEKTKPSTIALNYIAVTHGLPSGETAKKLISLVKQPLKFVRRVVDNIARESGYKILSSPPKRPKT